MFNLIKYENKNSRKSIFITLILLFTAFAMFQLATYYSGNFIQNTILGDSTTAHILMSKHPTIIGIISSIIFILIFLAIIMIVFSTIAFIINLANILVKDLYTNRKYITFSLPYTGKKIINTKLLISIFWIIVFPILLVIFNILFSLLLDVIHNGDFVLIKKFIEILKTDQLVRLKTYFEYGRFIYDLLNYLVFSIMFVLIIYSSIIFDYKIGRKKEKSNMWIIYSILVLLGIVFTTSVLFSKDGQYMDTALDGVKTYGEILNYGIAMDYNMYPTGNEIWTILFNLFISVILYLYIIFNFEKKLEI